MGQTCFVRYYDKAADDAGRPPKIIEISAHTLDDHRDRGFVQCGPAGEPLPRDQIIPRAEDAKPQKLATPADDPGASTDPAPPAPPAKKSGGSD